MTCHSVFPDRQAMRNLWNRKPSVKKRAGELPYKSISPAFSAVFNRTKRDFFAAKSFLLAARTKTSCRKTEKTTAEKRKNPSPGQLFFSIRTDSRMHNPPDRLQAYPPPPPTRPTASCAQPSALPAKKKAESPLSPSSCVSPTRKIRAKFRPARPRGRNTRFSPPPP